MSRQEEMNRTQHLRIAAVKQRDWYEEHLKHQPLTKATARLYRMGLNRFTQLVAMHDRHIERLKTVLGT